MDHFYETVPGWTESIPEVYSEMVRRFPSGSHFVELGSWLGRSASFMGVEIINSGKQITFDCVDHWKGSIGDSAMAQIVKNNDVHAKFLENTKLVHDIVNPKKMSGGRAARTYADGSLDFVFIDAAHDKDSVEHDIIDWWPKLKRGGVMAGHDYSDSFLSWVRQAVHTMFADQYVQPRGKIGGCWLVEKDGKTPDPDPAKARPRIRVAVPNRPGDSISSKTLAALWQSGQHHKLVTVAAPPNSLLNFNFNFNWVQALNRRGEFEFFVMMHADVAPEPDWLDMMISEYLRVGADVLSCSIAIKDERGMSSTGVMWWKDKIMRKLSVAQTLKLPTTFNAETLGADVLLMNTGLWICKMDRPWVEKLWPSTPPAQKRQASCFRCYDTIEQDTDGEYHASVIGEDYLWSVDLARMGVKTFATTAVRVLHAGGFDYPNFTNWGSEASHEVDFTNMALSGDQNGQRNGQQSHAAGSNGKGGVPAVKRERFTDLLGSGCFD